jgi:acetyl esterase/lipase
MARRQISRLSSLLTVLALLAAACTSSQADSTTADVPVASSTPIVTTTSTTSTTTATTSTTTTTSVTTTTAPASTSTTTTAPLPDIGVEVGVPQGVGPFPSVVLVHGGGWVAGSPAIIRSLAASLRSEGFLTVNTPYQLSNDRPGFPDAVDDVTCAVRYAAAHPDSDGSVVVIGHSAGAHISAIVALTGDQYGEDCPIPGAGIPDGMVGLAGPYDIERLGIVMLPFFGAGPNAAPAAWLAGNPQLLTDRNPELRSLIMYGELDGIVDSSFAFDFYDALDDSGSDVVLELVEGARHNDMRDPDFVAALIAAWLDR